MAWKRPREVNSTADLEEGSDIALDFERFSSSSGQGVLPVVAQDVDSRDVLVLCVGKSTYARCGIIVNVTPLEPTWEGYLTLEISNTTPLPAKIYGGEGIAQLVFFQGDEPPETAYADRKGKYQGQVGVTLPRL